MADHCGCFGRRGFMLGLASFSIAGTTKAQPIPQAATPCPEIVPQISVRAVPVTPILDESTNSFDLLRIMNQGRVPEGAVADHGARPAGLTTVQFDVDTKVRVSTAPRPDARSACIVPLRIDVTVTTKLHRIYVARDLAPPRTCLREVVMEHENRHARVNFDCLDDARASIHAAILRNVAALGRIESRNVETNAATAEFLGRVRPIVRDNFAAAIGRARARHAVMDSNEGYRRDWARCG
jgi:hypothetical protein